SAGSLVNALTIGTGLGGVSYNGSSAVTITNTDKGSDQNIFKNVALSGTGTNSITCVADANNDTLTLSASSTSGISISADATTDTITFTNTGVTGITANLVPSGGSFGGAGTINFTGTANQVHLNSSGSTLTFSAPQNIHTGATPTFAGMTLSGLTGYLKANGGSALTASSTIPSADISNTSFVDLTTSQAASGVKTFNNAVLCKESLEIHNFNLVNGLWFMKSDSTYPYRVILTGNNISHIIGGTSVYTLLFQNNNGSLSLKANGTVEASSTVQATGFKTASGTSAQFLKADGSVDSTTYLSGTVAVANGGTGATTLTGYVKGNGTSAFTASSTVPWSDVSGAPSFLTSAVTSLTGTTNQVTVSASTGSVTVSLPQNIHTGASVQFNSLGIGTAAGAAGEIRATDNITAYYTSDERLKTNVRPIENALDKVSQLDGVIYDWNDTYKKDHGDVDGYFVRADNSGVIAQQVEKVFPNVVADRADGFKAVRYELLVPLLIEAIKDLKAEIEALKAQK
ncbi:MAG: tail fiber domain-containing protein, partial [Euryarchaeota archaeon]|nr:tail fiber domain-containing protein [Euryarchaeota archaeon]